MKKFIKLLLFAIMTLIIVVFIFITGLMGIIFASLSGISIIITFIMISFLIFGTLIHIITNIYMYRIIPNKDLKLWEKLYAGAIPFGSIRILESRNLVTYKPFLVFVKQKDMSWDKKLFLTVAIRL